MLVYALIVAVIIVVVVVAVLSVLPNSDGNPYIDLEPASLAILGIFTWGGTALINAVLLGAGFTGFGLLLAYLYYNYLRGQKTTVMQTATGYNPQPVTPTAAPTNEETVIS